MAGALTDSDTIALVGMTEKHMIILATEMGYSSGSEHGHIVSYPT